MHATLGVIPKPRVFTGGARDLARITTLTFRIGASRLLMSDHSKSSPLATYFAVWGALLLGTYITYRATLLDLYLFNHSLNAAVALIIATTKALLVALFFMHLRHASEKLLKLVVISTLFFLLILLALSMADYGTRAWS
jgi:cytochrome c oxidase subunit IV